MKITLKKMSCACKLNLWRANKDFLKKRETIAETVTRTKMWPKLTKSKTINHFVTKTTMWKQWKQSNWSSWFPQQTAWAAACNGCKKWSVWHQVTRVLLIRTYRVSQMFSPVYEQRRLKAVFLSGAQHAQTVLNDQTQFSRRPGPERHTLQSGTQDVTHTHSSSGMRSHSLRSLVNQAVDGIPPLSLPVRRQQLHDVQRQTAQLVRLSAGRHLHPLLQLRLTAEHHAAHEHLQHTQSAPLPSDTDLHHSLDQCVCLCPHTVRWDTGMECVHTPYTM